jgi:predicted outer membrane repeat protein
MLKKNILIRILTIASLLLVNLQWGIVSASPVDTELQNAILYVKPGANGDCLSWDTACELQTAIFNAVSGDQIWVAAGSYKPTMDTNRTAAFQLKSGVAIYGGFPAAGGDWSQRDWETYPATLSGDIGVSGNNADNSYHVVKSNGVDASAILDGFTISLGYANGTSNDTGGGMYNRNSSPTLSNVTFSGNTAIYYGGGMHNDNSSPILSNVTFSGNTASYFGGGMHNDNSSPILSNVTFSSNSASYYGGGMSNTYSSSSTLSNVTFIANTAGNFGGGMYNNSSSPSLSNVTFSGNTASNHGGGMSNFGGSASLSNVTFIGNTATRSGGGMYNYNNSATLSNVTFIDNLATNDGGGMFNSQSSSTLSDITFSGNTAGSFGGGMYNLQGNPTLSNVTFSSNSATNDGGGMYNNSSSPRLTNVTFSGNSAANDGGGMYNSQGDLSLTNVTFSGNSAANDGGGMYNLQGNPSLNNITFSGNNAEHFGGGMLSFQSSPTLRNVTFSGNTATNNGGGIYNLQGSPTLTNAILWGNTPDQIRGDSTTVTYSDVQGGYPGTGNINDDPLLGPLADNGGLTQTHAIAAGSPAIDAGDPDVCPNIDQRAFTRPIDGDENGTAICDMGAYEYGSYPAVFSLTVEHVGNGTTTKNPDKLEYLWGESVTLTATADPAWLFIGWSGDVTGNDNPLVITITGNTNVTALFTTNRIFLPMITR